MPRLNDLRLLFGLIRHPVRWWQAWRSVTGQLFQGGGVAIDTPPGGDGQPIALRTVIQPDGDVLVLVREGWEPDEALVADHQARVATWYEESSTVVGQGVGALRASLTAISLGAGGGGGWTTFDQLQGAAGLAAGFAVATVVFGAVRLALGRAGSVVLRRRIDRWLGRNGLLA